MPSIIPPNPAPQQPTDQAAGIAADIIAYAAEPYGSLTAYSLGYMKSAAAAVVNEPSKRNRQHLADVLAAVELAERQYRADLARRVAEAEQHLAEVEAQGGAQ